MKNSKILYKRIIVKYLPVASIMLFLILMISGQPGITPNSGNRDVIKWWEGWEGDPDTITVKIDTGFTDAQKDSIRSAIDRWNGAGCQPKMKEDTSSGGSADITVGIGTFGGDTIGLCSYTRVGGGNNSVTGATITLDTSAGFDFAELATHELGHAVGLDDTDHNANPSDNMKGVGSTGNHGALSSHDSTEAMLAGIMATWDFDWMPPLNPLLASVPGTPVQIEFDLGTSYPPDIAAQAMIMVDPIYDPLMYYEGAFVEDNMLYVSLFSDPMHWSGEYFLMIDIQFPPPYDPVNFLGQHYININPAEPVDFECPFEIFETRGMVKIKWVDFCTYPLPNPLRSTLVVDDILVFKVDLGNGDYTINLEPGEHLIELFVDDYQVNEAYSSQTFLVTGVDEPAATTGPELDIYPNPFRETCLIKSDPGSEIRIYDITGKMIRSLEGGTSAWTPSPGTRPGFYFVKAVKGEEVMTGKVLYLR